MPFPYGNSRLAIQQKAARNRLHIEKTVVELEEKTLNRIQITTNFHCYRPLPMTHLAIRTKLPIQTKMLLKVR